MKMPSAECVRVAEILQQYLDSEGTAEEALRVERHLDECRSCGLEAGALQDLKDAVRRHGERDAGAREQLKAFAERLARGEIDHVEENS
jgi:anti-sigma factor RsiW